MSKTLKILPLVGLLSACTFVPSGPSVLALPSADKNYEQFHNDDMFCRNTAQQQTKSLQDLPYPLPEIQQQYDLVYIQCMYGNGHHVPALEGDDAAYDGQAYGEQDFGSGRGQAAPPPPGMSRPR